MGELTALLIAACASVPVLALGLLLGRAWRAGDRLRTIVIGLTFLHETSLVALPALAPHSVSPSSTESVAGFDVSSSCICLVAGDI